MGDEVTRTDAKRSGEKKSHHVLNSSVNEGTNGETGEEGRRCLMKLSFVCWFILK